MLYRTHITIAEHGASDADAERFLECFAQAHPETGPVVSRNLEDGSLTVVFSFEADEFAEIADRAARIFEAGWTATKLPPTPVLGVEIEPVVDSPVDEQPLAA